MDFGVGKGGLPNSRAFWRTTARRGWAALLAGLVTLPFFLWGPHDFWRSVVQFQFMQPLRMDALSHLVWMRGRLPWLSPVLLWIPWVALAPAIALAISRCPRSPAAFAGAVAMVHLIFFALNKQAFANYYYFVIGAAAWAAAATPVCSLSRTTSPP